MARGKNERDRENERLKGEAARLTAQYARSLEELDAVLAKIERLRDVGNTLVEVAQAVTNGATVVQLSARDWICAACGARWHDDRVPPRDQHDVSLALRHAAECIVLAASDALLRAKAAG